MGKDVYFLGGEMVSALGLSLKENMQAIKQMQSGMRLNSNRELSNEDFYCAAIERDKLKSRFSGLNFKEKHTFFEQLLIYSMQKALKKTAINPASGQVGIVLSTTKGNIDLLNPGLAKDFPENRIHLWAAADAIARHFGNPNRPLVVSNACVSGVLAINLAASLIRRGKYETVLVLGGDLLSKFVISGFQSFQSLSSGVCKPFDANRDGLNLGEAGACMILSAKQGDTGIKILGGSTHNDANHISGPSRTAEGFYYAATSAIRASGIKTSDIGYISAHGTATPYNDEMEAKGIGRLGLENVPVHSLKAFWGHTLGAAGIIESLAQIASMQEGILLPTLCYEKHGVPVAINVTRQVEKANPRYALKLASGFSGVNSSVIFENERAAR